MKFASFWQDGKVLWGIVEGETLVPVGPESARRYPSLRAAIAADALSAVLTSADRGQPIPLESIRWAPVIPDATKIICVGLNYENHRKETERPVVDHPTIFLRLADSQIGHLQPLIKPRVSNELDYEGELAIVIGKGGRSIPATDALNHIAGFTAYNDGSVRDWQRHTMQFTPGKNFPGTGAFGPWLVTPEEFGDIPGKRIQTRLNGQVMQDAHFADLIFPLDQLIAYCSAFTPLSAGDVIVTGTPGGVGAKRNPPVFMKHGDVVEVEIDGIGVLRNPIANEA